MKQALQTFLSNQKGRLKNKKLAWWQVVLIVIVLLIIIDGIISWFDPNSTENINSWVAWIGLGFLLLVLLVTIGLVVYQRYKNSSASSHASGEEKPAKVVPLHTATSGCHGGHGGKESKLLPNLLMFSGAFLLVGLGAWAFMTAAAISTGAYAGSPFRTPSFSQTTTTVTTTSPSPAVAPPKEAREHVAIQNGSRMEWIPLRPGMVIHYEAHLSTDVDEKTAVDNLVMRQCGYETAAPPREGDGEPCVWEKMDRARWIRFATNEPLPTILNVDWWFVPA